MELQIYPDQFVILYSPLWMIALLFSGLVLFILSKSWRDNLKKSHQYSFLPGVLFTISIIFLMGGINLYVYKIVLNKDQIILFNIKQFNQQIKWSEISQVEYKNQQQIILSINETAHYKGPVNIDLTDLDKESMAKVKILIALKVKQSRLKKTQEVIN